MELQLISKYDLLLYQEDGGSIFLRNTDNYLPDNTVSHPKTQNSSILAVSISIFHRPNKGLASLF
jgi:hypothetical protein